MELGNLKEDLGLRSMATFGISETVIRVIYPGSDLEELRKRKILMRICHPCRNGNLAIPNTS
jgi:hypothetical protein